MEKQVNEQINQETKNLTLESEHRHHRHHRHHQHHRHSSSRNRRKQRGFVRYKIKHFFRKIRRMHHAGRRNPNRVEQKVMFFWILASILSMVLLIPIAIWIAGIIDKA